MTTEPVSGPTNNEEIPPDLKLEDISDGMNERGIPKAKFITDVAEFAASFQPEASAELLIGAYTDLHSKYKQKEYSSTQKRKKFGQPGCVNRLFVHLPFRSLQKFD
jgi:hypothetical protein